MWSRSHTRSERWPVLNKTELRVFQGHQIRAWMSLSSSQRPKGAQESSSSHLYALPSGSHPRPASSFALSVQEERGGGKDAGWRSLLVVSSLPSSTSWPDGPFSLFIKRQSSNFFKCKKFNVFAIVLHYFFFIWNKQNITDKILFEFLLFPMPFLPSPEASHVSILFYVSFVYNQYTNIYDLKFYMHFIILSIFWNSCFFTQNYAFKIEPCWIISNYWTLSHFMTVPLFVYPFFYWWTFTLFPMFSLLQAMP